MMFWKKSGRVGEGPWGRLSPHQTGRADFPHPAYPVISAQAFTGHEYSLFFCRTKHRKWALLYAWLPFGLLPSFHLGRETFFRGGRFLSKRISVPVMETHYWQRAFAPRALPRFVATMPSSDSWPDPTPVMRSRRRSRRIRPNPHRPTRSLRFPIGLSTPAVPYHPGEPDRCTRSLLLGRRQASPLSEGWPLSPL